MLGKKQIKPVLFILWNSTRSLESQITFFTFTSCELRLLQLALSATAVSTISSQSLLQVIVAFPAYNLDHSLILCFRRGTPQHRQHQSHIYGFLNISRIDFALVFVYFNNQQSGKQEVLSEVLLPLFFYFPNYF